VLRIKTYQGRNLPPNSTEQVAPVGSRAKSALVAYARVFSYACGHARFQISGKDPGPSCASGRSVALTKSSDGSTTLAQLSGGAWNIQTVIDRQSTAPGRPSQLVNILKYISADIQDILPFARLALHPHQSLTVVQSCSSHPRTNPCDFCRTRRAEAASPSTAVST